LKPPINSVAQPPVYYWFVRLLHNTVYFGEAKERYLPPGSPRQFKHPREAHNNVFKVKAATETWFPHPRPFWWNY
jgi:hypothetical protein